MVRRSPINAHIAQMPVAHLCEQMSFPTNLINQLKPPKERQHSVLGPLRE